MLARPMTSDLAAAAREGGLRAVSLLGGQAVSYLIAGIGSIIIARLLGPEGYGLYSLALAVPTLVALFTDFGVSQALVRLTARERGSPDLPGKVTSALLFALFTALAAASAGVLAAPLLSEIVVRRSAVAFAAAVGMAYVALNSVALASYSTLLGLGDARGLALAPVARETVKTLAAPALILLGLGYLGAVVGHVAGYAAFAAFTVARVVKQLGVAKPAEPAQVRLLLSYGLPLYAGTVVSTLISTYQLSVLAWLVSDVEIGNFRAASNFAALLSVLSAPIASALFPMFSVIDGPETAAAFRYSVRYTALVLVPAGVFTALAAPDLVRTVYGREYALAPLYLSLQALAYLYAGLGSAVLGSYFQGLGKPEVNFRAALVSSAVILVLTPPLAAAFRVAGAVAATLAAALASLLYLLREAGKLGAKLDLNYSRRVYLASLLAGLAQAPLLLLELHPLPRLALSAAVFLAAYLACCVLVRCLTLEDVERLKSILAVPLLKPLVDSAARLAARFIASLERSGSG